MTIPEQPSKEVQKSLPHAVVDSIIPPLDLPLFESGRYVLDMRMNRSWPAQLFTEDEVRFTDNHAEVERWHAVTAKTLAWVNFFAKPEITIRHSPLALEKGKHYNVEYRQDFPSETLTGQRFSVGENQYVVNYDPKTGLEFKSYSQIVQEEELTPYMEEWLARVISKENRIHPIRSSLQPFAKWLYTKRPYNDFDPTYAKEF